ncbi:transcription repressor OFP1 [Ziziphus jujuba]|uniref:Transcription repressor n=2 Tax=Ziziphus jujuba TaxID=326968 RepID=A0A6P4BED2_ZIZJJ|nr:transcription repressor OFP1 [Ziziphus jujuba]KAH7514737.1 hypothetical protein FEM48_Zijuj11G0122300 [Ziziphus jujuba var. spinosa]
MGNYKFRLSDMMPNAWFYKLKDMGKSRNHGFSQTRKKKQPTLQESKPKQQPHHQCHPRKSYYFTRELTHPGDRIYASPTNPKTPETIFPDPPRKSDKQRARRRRRRGGGGGSSSSPKLVASSVSAGCSCRATLESVWTKSDSPPEYYYSSSSPFDTSPESPPELTEVRCDRVLATETTFDGMVSWSAAAASCGFHENFEANDIVIDVDKTSLCKKSVIPDGLDSLSELELPPIITKPSKFNDMVRDVKKKESRESGRHRRSSTGFEEKDSLSVKVVKEERVSSLKEQRNSSVRRFALNSPGVKLRVNSPRIGSKRVVQSNGRKSVSSSSLSSSRRRSLSESFAIVKSSFDPQKDFRESMVEMIVENNIRASKDLEDLLACYLSLNSDEYHDLIIKVFKQIWFDLTDISSK